MFDGILEARDVIDAAAIAARAAVGEGRATSALVIAGDLGPDLPVPGIVLAAEGESRAFIGRDLLPDEGGAIAIAAALPAGFQVIECGEGPLAYLAVSGGDAPALARLANAMALTFRHWRDRLKIGALEAELAATHQRLARQNEMLEQASATLVNDGQEVVRVLGEIEERDRILDHELQHALRFQRAMLPKKLTRTEVDIEVVYLPAEIVSGDIYDIYDMGDERIRILVADAAGHGVTAALTTMFIKSNYDQHKHLQPTPSALLSALNAAVAAYGSADMRFTALCADVFPRSHKIVYATAAHPPPLLAIGPESMWLESGGSFVGLGEQASYPEFTVPFARDHGFYIVTDGAAESTNAAGEPFGEERLARLIGETHAKREIIGTRVVPALGTFVGDGRSLSDDVTILSARLA